VLLPRPVRLPAELAADWQETLEMVADFEDGLGLHVDRPIREVVAALWMRRLPTRMSCGGHLNWSRRTPWVDIGWFDERFAHDQPSESVHQRRLAAANRRLAQRLKSLVSAFNLARPERPIWQRLIIAEPTYWRPASIELYGGTRLYDQAYSERSILLTQMRREMTAFARYLLAALTDGQTAYYVWE
jgi:hypothetical protein